MVDISLGVPSFTPVNSSTYNYSVKVTVKNKTSDDFYNITVYAKLYTKDGKELTSYRQNGSIRGLTAGQTVETEIKSSIYGMEESEFDGIYAKIVAVGLYL